jgi:hypothetical protein
VIVVVLEAVALSSELGGAGGDPVPALLASGADTVEAPGSRPGEDVVVTGAIAGSVLSGGGWATGGVVGPVELLSACDEGGLGSFCAAAPALAGVAVA